jgi:hypothetical protein
MFNNGILKQCGELASQFNVPYLVPPSNNCHYCQMLKKYPNLSGTHENGCETKRLRDERNKSVLS